MAYCNMEEAKIGFASRNVEGLAFNRRYYMRDGSVKMNPGYQNPDIVKPADIVDSEFFVVRVDREDGSLMGVLTSFAMHLCTTRMSGACSADYPGQICKQLREHYGNDIGYLSLTGWCGDVNSVDVTKTAAEGKLKRHKEIGIELAQHAIEMLDAIETKDVDTVACISSEVTCHTRRPTKEDCLNAPSTNNVSMDVMAEMLRALRYPNEEVTLEVWTALIGQDAIQMLPGELFARFGVNIKERSGCEHTIVAELCNADIGYVYTKEAEIQGSYEATPSTYVRMDSDTGYKIVDAAVKNIQKIKEV